MYCVEKEPVPLSGYCEGLNQYRWAYSVPFRVGEGRTVVYPYREGCSPPFLLKFDSHHYDVVSFMMVRIDPSCRSDASGLREYCVSLSKFQL